MTVWTSHFPRAPWSVLQEINLLATEDGDELVTEDDINLSTERSDDIGNIRWSRIEPAGTWT